MHHTRWAHGWRWRFTYFWCIADIFWHQTDGFCFNRVFLQIAISHSVFFYLGSVLPQANSFVRSDLAVMTTGRRRDIETSRSRYILYGIFLCSVLVLSFGVLSLVIWSIPHGLAWLIFTRIGMFVLAYRLYHLIILLRLLFLR